MISMRLPRIFTGLLLLWSGMAWAQVSPTPPFTVGHTVRCQNTTCTVFSDGGPASGSAQNGQFYLTEIGITNTGTPFCVNDALTNAAGGYHRFCVGANSLGGGLISYDALGGATALPMQFEVNGTTYAFPGTSTANVTATGAFASGNLVCSNNTTGTGVIACGVIRAVNTNATVATGDNAGVIVMNGDVQATLTVPAASGFNSGFCTTIINGDDAPATYPSAGGHGKIVSGVTLPNFNAAYNPNIIYPGQSFRLCNNGGTWKASNPGRYAFTAATTIYVDPSGGGLDTNDGLSVTTAMRNPESCFYRGMSAFDANAFDGQTCQIISDSVDDASGCMHLSASALPGGQGGAEMLFDGFDPRPAGVNHTIHCSSSSAIGTFVDTTIQIRRIKLSAQSGQNCLNVGYHSYVQVLDGVDFGASAGCGNSVFQISDHGHLNFVNNFTMSGTYTFGFIISTQGSVTTSAITVTGGTNTVTDFITTNGGYINLASVTWSGFTITGQRALVSNGTMLVTGPAGVCDTDLPGTAATGYSNGGRCNNQTGQPTTNLTGTLTTAQLGGSAAGFVNVLMNAGMSQWRHGTNIAISTSGGWGPDGIFILPTGAGVTAVQLTPTVPTTNVLEIQGATSNTDVKLRFVLESFTGAPLKFVEATFQFTLNNSSGASITPTFTSKMPTAQDNWAASTTDIPTANMQACANGSTCVESVTFQVGANSYLGYEVIIDLGAIGNTKNVIIEIPDMRATPGLSTFLTPATLIPTPELRDPAGDARWVDRFFGSSYDNGVAPGTVTAVGENVLGLTAGSNSAVTQAITYPQMRCDPVVTFYSPVTGASGKAADLVNAADVTPTALGTGQNGLNWTATPSSGAVAKIAVQHTRDCTISGG